MQINQPLLCGALIIRYSRQNADLRKHINARPYFFPQWPSDLYDRLSRYAIGEAAGIVDMRPQTVSANRYAASPADAESGESVRFTGNDSPGALAGQDLGRMFQKLSSTAMRGGLSGEALALTSRAEQRKDRRTGTVILDILTDEPGDAPERISVEEDEEN